MRNDKVQTGLRIPEAVYDQLKETADRSGVSINNQILYLIDVGLKAVSLGLQEEARILSHSQKDIGE